MQSGEADTYFSTFKNLLKNVVISGTVTSGGWQCKKRFVYILRTTVKWSHHEGFFFNRFQHWTEEIILFVVKSISMLPHAEKKTNSNRHHVYYGLHVIPNFTTYAEKATYEWEKIFEEQCNMHGGFQNTQKSPTYNFLFEVSEFLSKSHGDKKDVMLIHGRHTWKIIYKTSLCHCWAISLMFFF